MYPSHCDEDWFRDVPISGPYYHCRRRHHVRHHDVLIVVDDDITFDTSIVLPYIVQWVDLTFRVENPISPTKTRTRLVVVRSRQNHTCHHGRCHDDLALCRRRGSFPVRTVIVIVSFVDTSFDVVVARNVNQIDSVVNVDIVEHVVVGSIGLV